MFKMEVLNDYDNADTISIDTLALEEMIQEERAREISELNNLSKKVCNLHTSLLYYRNAKSKRGAACYEAWRMLIKKIGGSPNTWRDVGYAVGIDRDDLDYIRNTVKDDPADVVLKLFTQNEKATLDKILDVFVKMQRYDILKAIEEPLTDLAQCFKKDDSAYHSSSKNNTREIITYTSDLISDLPPALSKKFVIKEKEQKNPKQPQLRPPDKQEVVLKNQNPVLFLTYADDGLATAFNIKYLVSNWLDISGVTVITLNDRRDEVYQNPEKFIREYFEKADFVVPIVTSSYLQEIKSHNPNVPNTSDNLDCKYVNFIYNLATNHYIHASGCMNKKVRSVLPQNVSVSVFREIAMYPVLMPWTLETSFDEQFKAFLKIEC